MKVLFSLKKIGLILSLRIVVYMMFYLYFIII